MLLRLVQPTKALAPTVSRDSGNDTLNNRLQPLKASLPMEVAVVGSCTDRRCSHPANASGAMDVTISLLLFNVTNAGMTMSPMYFARPAITLQVASLPECR